MLHPLGGNGVTNHCGRWIFDNPRILKQFSSLPFRRKHTKHFCSDAKSRPSTYRNTFSLLLKCLPFTVTVQYVPGFPFFSGVLQAPVVFSVSFLLFTSHHLLLNQMVHTSGLFCYSMTKIGLAVGSEPHDDLRFLYCSKNQMTKDLRIIKQKNQCLSTNLNCRFLSQ